MKVLRDALRNSAADAKKANANSTGKSNDILAPVRRWTDIFDKSIDKLGLLNSDEVSAVLDAYLPLKELSSKLRILESRIPPEHRRVEYSEGPLEDYALIAAKDTKYLGTLFDVYVPSFDTAIQKLSDNQKMER